ncbi:MAG: hypothetical protein WBA17_00150, partial [Saprospiraceae bacterium]
RLTFGFAGNGYGQMKIDLLGEVPFKYELATDRITMFYGVSEQQVPDHPTGGFAARRSIINDTITYSMQLTGENLELSSEEETSLNKFILTRYNEKSDRYRQPQLITDLPLLSSAGLTPASVTDYMKLYVGKPIPAFAEIYPPDCCIANEERLLNDKISSGREIEWAVSIYPTDDRQATDKRPEPKNILLIVDRTITVDCLSEVFDQVVDYPGRGVTYLFYTVVTDAETGEPVIYALDKEKLQAQTGTFQEIVGKVVK